MSHQPVKKKVRILDAKYVRDAESILILGECDEGRLHHQINRSCFSFGNRTDAEIHREMEKTAELMKGKEIYMVFDPNLDAKMRDRISIGYK